MASTNITTLATALPTEHLIAAVLQEARPHNVVAPLVLNDVLPYGQGRVWKKVKLPTTTAASVDEGSDITATARTTGSASVTIAEVGLNTEVTDFAKETTATVVADLLTWAKSQGRAIAQKITGDLCALFSALNDGTAVGTTNTNITVANFIEGMYTLDSQNAPGAKKCVLHPRQTYDLFSAIEASTGTPWSNVGELVRQGRLPSGTPESGFCGVVFGVPVYQTTEVPTANSAVDRAGGMFVRDALAIIKQRPVRTEYDRDGSARTTEVIVTTSYGVGEVEDNYGVPIVTDA